MSLQLLAKQMEAKGRKGDSMLVHMTPDEVAGLQKLAESAGGSLSVNPETGLVEANFLKRLLPTLAGIGVGMFAGPMAGAAAGALVGNYRAKREGTDRTLGTILGGLGGYGGASLASGLATAGSSAVTGAGAGAGNVAGNIAGNAAGTGATTVGQQVGQDAATKAAMYKGLQTSGAEAAQNVLQSQAASAGAEGTIGEAAAQEFAQKAAAQPTMYTYDDGSTLSALADGTTTATPGIDAVQPATATTRLAQAGRGIGNMGTERGREAFATKFGLKTAGMAAAPMLMPEQLKEEEDKLKEDDEMYYTEYNPGQTGQRSSTSTEAQQFAERRFSPMERISADEYMERRNRRYAAEGGLMRLAEGGATDAAPADAGIAGGISGASKAAYDYLMGRSASPIVQQAAVPMSSAAATTLPVADAGQVAALSDREFVFNPATGAFSKNPSYADPAAVKAPTGYIGDPLGIFSGIGNRPSGSDEHSQADIGEFSKMSDSERAAYMRDNPREAAFNRFAKDVFDLTLMGQAVKFGQNQLNPGFRERLDMINRGIDPGYSGSSGDFYGDPSDYAGMTQGELAESGGGVGAAAGGLMSLAKGGMKSGGFVIPADVVSMVGEGNTDAGYSRIKSMVPGATAIKGKDGGQADTVKTSIEGKQPARVAHGEMYVPPETVKRMGGAKKLYAMMDKVRAQATGSKKQIKPVNLKRALA